MRKDWRSVLVTLFRYMYAGGVRCENWDQILELHDEEDRKYFYKLEDIYLKKGGHNGQLER